MTNEENVLFSSWVKPEPDPKRRGRFREAISDFMDAVKPLTREPFAADPVRTTASVMFGYRNYKVYVN